jgi:hypothetical protein
VGAAFKPPDVGLYPELAALTGGSRNFGRLVLWPDDIGDTPAGAVPGHELPSLARKLGKKTWQENLAKLSESAARSAAKKLGKRVFGEKRDDLLAICRCRAGLRAALVPARAQERTQQPGAQHLAATW